MIKRRTFLKISSLTSISFLGGCASSTLNNMIGSVIGNGKTIRSSNLTKKNIILKGDEYIIKNGYLVNQFTNRKIFDEEGDIIFTHIIENDWYYIVHKPNTKKYTLKRLLNKKTIKDFNVANLIALPSKNKMFILTSFGNYSIADNVYEFNGTSIELINKNLSLSGYVTNGSYLVNDKTAIDVFGKIYDNNTFKVPLTQMIGSAFNNLIALNTTAIFNGDNIISAYNRKENKIYTLLSQNEIRNNYKITYPEIQFLKSGHKIVLKIFLPTPKYIYLNELYEISNVDQSFKPIKVTQFHEYANNEIYSKYTLAVLYLYLNKVKKPIF